MPIENSTSEASETDIIGIGGGENIICEHVITDPYGNELDESFHSFGGDLLDLSDNDERHEWMYSIPPEEVNIYSYIERYNVPREYVDAMNANGREYYWCDYNTDAIYGGLEAAEKYYITGSERYDYYVQKAFLLGLKGKLHTIIYKDSRYSDWVSEKRASDDWYYSPYNGNSDTGYDGSFTGEIRQWSIPEVIEYFDIDRETLDDAILISKSYAMYACDLDTDALYDADVRAKIIDDLKSQTDFPAADPVDIDNAFISFDANIYAEACEYVRSGGRIHPGDEYPFKELPAEETFDEEVPAEEVPAEEVPVEEVPAEAAP